jgi:2,5-diamino-6-(ribosylamino)-4(3H)-pyrimidinone 5'-phosphate reductase
MRRVQAPERLPVVSGFEDLVYEPRPLLVVPDSRGRVRNWIHALAQPWTGAIVVLTSQATPPDYLEYLNRRGIAHLTVGEDRIDLSAGLELLQAR